MTEDASKRPNWPTRAVLKGVPRVAFETEPGKDAETVPFPACLGACLEYMGEGLGQRHLTWRDSTVLQNLTYIHLMGTTGAAFRLSWRPGWHLDNVEITHMSDDPSAPYDRAFEAVGYAHQFLFPEEGRDDEAYWRERIAESISAGRPVLGFGVVGPPECCIITGYDEAGDVLIGWSFFQQFPEFKAGVEFEPLGYFRKRDWFKDTQALLLTGEKRDKPLLGEIYRKALQWALQVARTPQTSGGHHNGLAAYEAWAEHLLREDDFATDDVAALRMHFMVHNDAVGTVAEGRWYAACFLGEVAGEEPIMAADLQAAAHCYEAEHDLMWQLWNLVGGLGFSDQHVRKLAEPAIRRQMLPAILEARDKDAEATKHIEKALSR